MRDEEAVVFIMGMIILAGVGLLIATMMNRRRMREMTHRERIAMIGRGLIPSPERDPAGFESATGLTARPADAGTRYRTAGVLMIGLGLALMVLITFTSGEPGVGTGVGGGAILGAASLFNYFLISRRESDLDRWTPAPRRPDPPSNVS